MISQKASIKIKPIEVPLPCIGEIKTTCTSSFLLSCKVPEVSKVFCPPFASVVKAHIFLFLGVTPLTKKNI